MYIVYVATSANPTVTSNTYASNSQGDLLIDGSGNYFNTNWNEAAGTVYRVVRASAFNIEDAILTISTGVIVKVNPDVLIQGYLVPTGSWTPRVRPSPGPTR